MDLFEHWPKNDPVVGHFPFTTHIIFSFKNNHRVMLYRISISTIIDINRFYLGARVFAILDLGNKFFRVQYEMLLLYVELSKVAFRTKKPQLLS